MRMRVDEAGKHRGVGEIDDPHPGRDGDPSFGTDLGDAFAAHDDHLLDEHLDGDAVEQPAGPDGDARMRRRALVYPAPRAHTRRVAGHSPGPRPYRIRGCRGRHRRLGRHQHRREDGTGKQGTGGNSPLMHTSS